MNDDNFNSELENDTNDTSYQQDDTQQVNEPNGDNELNLDNEQELEIPYVPYSNDFIPKGINIDKIKEDAKNADLEDSKNGKDFVSEEAKVDIEKKLREKREDYVEEVAPVVGGNNKEDNSVAPINKNELVDVPVAEILNNDNNNTIDSQTLVSVAKKKIQKRKQMIMFLIVCGVAAFLAGIGMFMHTRSNKPNHVVNQVAKNPVDVAPTEDLEEDSYPTISDEINHDYFEDLVGEDSIDLYADLKEEVRSFLIYTNQDNYKITGIEIEDNTLTVSMTFPQDTKKNILELNEFVLKTQVGLKNLLVSPIKVVCVKPTLSGNRFEYTSKFNILDLIDTLKYQDRHSYQLWWTETNVLKNGINYKNNLEKKDLYVDTVGPRWGDIEENTNDLVAELPEVDMELVWKQEVRDDRFNLKFYIPSHLSYEKYVTDKGSFIIETSADKTGFKLLLLTSNDTFEDYTVDELFDSTTAEFESVSSMTSIGAGTFNAFDSEQTIKYKTYRDNKTNLYMYYILGMKNNQKYELLITMPFDTFINSKDYLDLNIPRIEYGGSQVLEDYIDPNSVPTEQKEVDMLDLSGFTSDKKEVDKSFTTEEQKEALKKEYEKNTGNSASSNAGMNFGSTNKTPEVEEVSEQEETKPTTSTENTATSNSNSNTSQENTTNNQPAKASASNDLGSTQAKLDLNKLNQKQTVYVDSSSVYHKDQNCSEIKGSSTDKMDLDLAKGAGYKACPNE